MTHFEYISVGAALIFALVIGRLVGGLAPALAKERRYWVHAGWIVVLLLITVFQWWGIWRVRAVEWTPIRFLWLLMLPGILLARAILLVGANPDSIESFKQHFFQIRLRFFGLGLASGLHLFLTPWIAGVVPWLVEAPAHRQAVIVSIISILGLSLRNETFHWMLVLVSLASVITGFVLIPLQG